MTDAHIEPAAKIAAMRYREARAGMTLMPEEFADPYAFMDRLSNIIENHPGAVFLNDDGGLGAFIIGYRIDQFQGSARGVYVPEWGHGVDPALPIKRSERVYRELYSNMLKAWVAEGCPTFAVSIYPTDTRLREVLFWGGFGMIVCDAMRGVFPPETECGRAAPPVTIGRGGVDQMPAILSLAGRLQEHLADAPIYLYPGRDEDETSMRRWLESPGHHLWLAWQGERPVGFIRCQPPEPTVSFIAGGPATTGITGMYVDPEFRGQGIGFALLSTLTAHAKDSGFQRISVDFETRNTPARQFWLRHFQPISYSLMRRIDDRFVRE